jgi:hypothetical protein
MYTLSFKPPLQTPVNPFSTRGQISSLRLAEDIVNHIKVLPIVHPELPSALQYHVVLKGQPHFA